MGRDIIHTALAQHVKTLNDCNQRGGRMLSLVDLVDAGSVNITLAGYLAAMMQEGASLLVGAKPGGAGKTAVMCACLNFLPATMEIRVIDRGVNIQQMDRDVGVKNDCFLAHEIGAGPYYAYVWGQQVRDFFSLSRLGYTIASNLHADTPGETDDQLCNQNGISRELVQGIPLKIYLRTSRASNGRINRWVSHVYESDEGKNNLVWKGDSPGNFQRMMPSQLVKLSDEVTWSDFLTTCQQNNIRRIEDVRLALMKTMQ
ncbi:MAG: hypothetical protein E4H27_06010 [Anaerolineales bacterium]|nr:MAG: hypothetical protein E4H27_06010 [Anaerolineales bacterium]